MKEEFSFKGFHFKPLRKLTKKERAKAITPKCVLGLASDYELNLTTYSHTYTWEDFYKASGNSGADLFICIENGKTYIPGSHELFLCQNI